MPCHQLQAQLEQYLDGELIDEARLDFEAHLATCQGCGARLEVARHNLTLVRSLAREASPAAPEHLRQSVFSPIEAEGRKTARARVGRLSAAAAGVALVAVAAQQQYRSYQFGLYEDDAALRHALGFPLEIQQQPPGLIEAWFNGKLDHRVKVPTFPNARATGARLLQVRDKPAALIRYDGNHPMSVFVFRDGDAAVGAEPAVDSRRGYNVVSWRDGEVVYQLVSDLDEEDIRQLVTGRPAGPPPVRTGPGVEASPASLRH